MPVALELPGFSIDQEEDSLRGGLFNFAAPVSTGADIQSIKILQ